MATLPNNTLQNVQTYQKAELAWMLNTYAGISTSNKKFEKFNDLTANLGDTVTFDLSPRSAVQYGLVVNPQASAQRLQSLICSQAANSSSAYTDQQFIFNVEDYMDRFGESRISELGNAVETDILKNFASDVRVNNPQASNFGQIVDPTSGPYRFYGDGTTPINSFQQLAQAQANFADYGAAKTDPCAYIPLVDVPAIVSNGLSQFATNRNNELADEWEFARVGQYKYYESNLLPIHYSGTVGDQALTLTLVSTNDPTGQNITQLTFSGANVNDPASFQIGDLCKFNFGVGSIPNVYYRQFIGHQVSQQPVQFRITSPAGSDGSGNVTVNIYPALQSTPGMNQNLSIGLIPGMQIFTLPSHRCGGVISGKPLYLAMPRLPDESPFSTVTTMDANTGCSLRHYWGSQFGQNVRMYVWDVIWGSTMVAENSMRLAFPLI